jgi:tRNA pseudouridine38-40 synthase
MSVTALVLAYDGREFAGWQRQPGERTVQGVVEAALARVHGASELTIVGAGRTDRGVHALGQVASYPPPTPRDPQLLWHALSRLLPPDLRVLNVIATDASFHACRSAIAKLYCYRMLLRPLALPFELPFAWQLHGQIDVEAMRQAARMLIGRHDFASFSVTGGQSKTTTREISRIELELSNDQQLSLKIEADGFLYRMVRVIVGLLVEIGRGRRSPRSIEALLSQPRFGAARAMAPPHGLCLVHVDYPSSFAITSAQLCDADGPLAAPV